jgi:beta-galactosidase
MMKLSLFIGLCLTILSLCTFVTSSSFPVYSDYQAKPYTVSYNNRAILLNNEPVLFVSGSIHYPRSTPAMWPQLLQQAREDGLNMVEIYTFWNAHEPVEGEWDFSGKNNILLFLEYAKQANLFVNLRIGPYVCAEWTSGGLPTWLAYKPGLLFRNYNQPWMNAMGSYVQTIVNLTRPYFADRGGPIVLAQIENELSTAASVEYVQWCGDFAQALQVNVPWIMCNGASANNTINSCNGNDCSGFIESHGQSGRILIDQPALWTENEQWYANFGDNTNENITQGFNRSPQDDAFAVARWFARGGSHMNYYMWHGGNNYGSSGFAGGTVSYADGANLHSDGLPHEPKKSHLQALHFTIAKYATDIVTNPALANKGVVVPYLNNQTGKFENGTQQQVFTYGNVAFLESSAPVYVTVLYNNQQYDMAPNSMLIFYNNQIVYNTDAVTPVPGYRAIVPVVETFQWQAWVEPVAVGSASTVPPLQVIKSQSPLEQLQITIDLTDYLYYQTTIQVTSEGIYSLVIQSTSCNAFVIFLDNAYVNNTYDVTYYWTSTDTTHRADIYIPKAGTHVLTLLSVSLGIEKGYNPGSGIKDHVKGIIGSVKLGDMDITNNQWLQQPYLVGQWINIYQPYAKPNVNWTTDYKQYANNAGIWYTTNFTITQPYPEGTFSILFDANGLNRGHIYVNGYDIAHYWLLASSSGEPSQRYYQIPPDWLNGMNEVNTLTIYEELGASNIDSVKICYSFIDGADLYIEDAHVSIM